MNYHNTIIQDVINEFEYRTEYYAMQLNKK